MSNIEAYLAIEDKFLVFYSKNGGEIEHHHFQSIGYPHPAYEEAVPELPFRLAEKRWASPALILQTVEVIKKYAPNAKELDWLATDRLLREWMEALGRI